MSTRARIFNSFADPTITVKPRKKTTRRICNWSANPNNLFNMNDESFDQRILLIVAGFLTLCLFGLSLALSFRYTDSKMKEHNAQYAPDTNAIILPSDTLKP